MPAEQRVGGRVGADDPGPVVDRSARPGSSASTNASRSCASRARLGLELFRPGRAVALTAATRRRHRAGPRRSLRIAPIARGRVPPSAATTTSATTATIATSHASTRTSIAQACRHGAGERPRSASTRPVDAGRRPVVGQEARPPRPGERREASTARTRDGGRAGGPAAPPHGRRGSAWRRRSRPAGWRPRRPRRPGSDETRSASSSSGEVPGGHGSSTRSSSTPALRAVAASASTPAASRPARRSRSARTASPFGP